MTNVEKVSLAGAKQIQFTAQPENSSNNNEQKQTSIKKYLTPPNVVLGSLATVGVLGMADVLICRGRHLNKLTGATKDIEAAISRATHAENELASAVNRATSLEGDVTEMNKQLNTLIDQLKRASGLDGEFKITGQGENINIWHMDTGVALFGKGDMIQVRLHNSRQGETILKNLQQLYSDIKDAPESDAKTMFISQIKKELARLDYEIFDDVKNYERYIDKLNISEANIEAPIITRPLIIDKKTGDAIYGGQLLVPLGSTPKAIN